MIFSAREFPCGFLFCGITKSLQAARLNASLDRAAALDIFLRQL